MITLQPIQQFIKVNGDKDSLIEKEVLAQAGYFSVDFKIRDLNLWIQVHLWCEINIGLEHYYYMDNTFWFDDSKNALQFILRF